MKKIITLLFLPVLFSISVTANTSGKTTSSQLSWMVGNWTGDAFGGQCEESWQPMSAGTMCGTYKQINDGKVNFYEFTVIKKESEGYSLKLKHFNPDMTGWETKDKVIEFPFVSASENKLVFDGLVYEKIDADRMKVTVNVGHSEGTVDEVTIVLKRVQ